MEVRERIAQSLHNAVWLTLGIERQDYRIERPFSATLTQASRSAITLAPETRIAEVFNHPDIARQLLILGEPGAGKTTMMLELAEDLLQRAIEDKAEPIPVLVNLSSWKDPKQPIFEWLVGELKTKYGIRQDLAQQWIQESQLLPLLDGLDEVAPQYQQACATALNNWLIGDAEQRPCGVLICCRREEFEQMVQQPLSLYGAIYLQTLTLEQIENYFAQFDLQDVWQTVQQDETLQELLTKPLFLSMFGLVQSQKTFSLQDWQLRTTSADKVEYLLDTYWEAAMSCELVTNPGERQRGIRSKTYGTKPLPDRKSIRRSLIFAAKMLDRESSTELLIEKMQPAALINWRQRWTYHLISMPFSGLTFGLTAGAILGLIAGLTFGRTNEMTIALTNGLAAGAIFGLIIGLVQGLISGLDTIQSVRAISISRKSQREIAHSLRKALVFGLILGLIGRMTGELVFGLFFGLIDGLKPDIQTPIKSNQGIKNSIRNTVIISGIALLFAFPLKFLLEYVLPDILTPDLVSEIALVCPIVLIWLGFQEGGGKALAQHLALRLVLAWNRYAPFRYDLLLNYCTERLLLQRIGGRYRFMHKTLQDYFAKMDLLS